MGQITAPEISKSFDKIGTDITSTSQIFLTGAAKNIDTLTIEGNETIRQGLKGAENFGVDIERSITKGAVNLWGDTMSTGRYAARNVVALVDNMQDNLTTVVQDVRVDVTNTVQVVAFVIAVGVAAAIIMYGDKIMERGIQLSGIEIL
jgi:hypothetical protein